MSPPVPASSSFGSLQPSSTLARSPYASPQPAAANVNVNVLNDAGGGDLGAASTLSRNSTLSKANRDRVDFSQLDAFERKLRKLKSPPGSEPEETHGEPTPPSFAKEPTTQVQSSGWKRGEWTTSYIHSVPTEPTHVANESTSTHSLGRTAQSLGDPAPPDAYQQKQVQHSPPTVSPRPALNQYTAAIHHAATRTNSLPGPSSPTSPQSSIPTHAHEKVHPASSRHSTLPADLQAHPPMSSAVSTPGSSFLSNPATATLTRGMKTIVDKLMLAPLQVAATTTAQVANLAVPDDPATHSDRKVLSAIQLTYSQISSAVDTYRSAVYALVEAETGLADVLLQKNLAATSTTVVDPRLGQALDEYGRGIHAHALSTIAYARALDSFAEQLHTFTSRALADCLETSRQANQVYTELELYRATGIAHLVAVNNQIVGGIQRAGAAAVAPALGLFGAGIGKSASRSNIGALTEEPATGSDGSMPAVPAVSVHGEPVAAHPTDATTVVPMTTSPSHLSPDSATSATRPRSRSNASTTSASFDLSQNFANDAHASNLRAKHAKLADALAAKTRVLQDKAVTDLAAQLAAVMAFQQGQQLGGVATAGGEDAGLVGEDKSMGGAKEGAAASDLGIGTGLAGGESARNSGY